MQVLPTASMDEKDPITLFFDKLPHTENIAPEMECIICKNGFVDEESGERISTDVQLPCASNCTQSVYHRECIESWFRMNPKKNTHCVYCQTKCVISPTPSPSQETTLSFRDSLNLMFIRLTYCFAFISMILLMYNGICVDTHKVSVILMYIICGALELTSCINVPSLIRIHEKTERYLYIRLFISFITIGCMSYIVFDVKDEPLYLLFDKIVLGLSVMYVLFFVHTRIRLMFV
jgi:hypothetical protein